MLADVMPESQRSSAAQLVIELPQWRPGWPKRSSLEPSPLSPSEDSPACTARGRHSEAAQMRLSSAWSDMNFASLRSPCSSFRSSMGDARTSNRRLSSPFGWRRPVDPEQKIDELLQSTVVERTQPHKQDMSNSLSWIKHSPEVIHMSIRHKTRLKFSGRALEMVFNWLIRAKARIATRVRQAYKTPKRFLFPHRSRSQQTPELVSCTRAPQESLATRNRTLSLRSVLDIVRKWEERALSAVDVTLCSSDTATQRSHQQRLDIVKRHLPRDKKASSLESFKDGIQTKSNVVSFKDGLVAV
ncbi:MAG: hypothetical protein SGPRY_014039 [Prymnesium sp.]